jgi:ribonucleoside-diphosphate reductase subunit M1
MQHGDQINSRIDYTRDFNYDFFGFKTLEKSYLLRVQDKKIVERP